MSKLIRTFYFDQVKVIRFDDHVHSEFGDKKVSLFYPPVHDEKFAEFGRMFGYTDPMQYGLEHDITHSWLATVIGLPYSPVIWADAHDEWHESTQQARDDDEHRTNRMLRYINTGEVDEDYGVLIGLFRNRQRLAAHAQELWKILRGPLCM